MDVDSQLDHRNQLVSILSIVYSKKKKIADKIFDKFSSILEQSDKKSIRKISSLILLSELLGKSDAKIKAKLIDDDLIKMKIYPIKNTFPSVLFEDLLEKLSDAFNVDISCSVYNLKDSTIQTIEI
jgi:hypothetical protein